MTVSRSPSSTGCLGGFAELTPAQLRALAAGLLRIAADAEARPMGCTYARAARRYELQEAVNAS